MSTVEKLLSKFGSSSSFTKLASEDDKEDKEKKEKEEKEKKEKEEKEKGKKDKDKDDEDDEKEKSASQTFSDLYSEAIDTLSTKDLSELNALAAIQALNIKTASEMQKEANVYTEAAAKGAGYKQSLKDFFNMVDSGVMSQGKRMANRVMPGELIDVEIPGKGMHRVRTSQFRKPEDISDRTGRAFGYGTAAAAGIAGHYLNKGVGRLAEKHGEYISGKIDQMFSKKMQQAAKNVQDETIEAITQGQREQGFLNSFGDRVKNVYNETSDLARTSASNVMDAAKAHKGLLAAGAAASIAIPVGYNMLNKDASDLDNDMKAYNFVSSVYDDLFISELQKTAHEFEMSIKKEGN